MVLWWKSPEWILTDQTYLARALFTIEAGPVFRYIYTFAYGEGRLLNR